MEVGQILIVCWAFSVASRTFSYLSFIMVTYIQHKPHGSLLPTAWLGSSYPGQSWVALSFNATGKGGKKN